MAADGKPIMVSVAEIRENGWNPNEVPAETMAQLRRNVERFGFNQPILVREHADGGFEVVDGAHRFRVAQDLGLDKIPVVVRQFTDAEAKAQTIAMNRLRGEMDPEIMARLVREIDEEGIEGVESLTEFIGYTADELDDMDRLLAVGADPEPEPPAPAGDQSGQLADAYHVLVVCPDETAQLALLERLEGEGFDCKAVVS